jgi:hypothetical protein
MGNALQNKGHANRRPIVCKKSLPTDCPVGEIVLETIERVNGDPCLWTLQGHWLIPGVTVSQSGELTVDVSIGTTGESGQTVTTELPFLIHVTDIPAGSTCVLFAVVKTTDGCEYAAVEVISFPALP